MKCSKNVFKFLEKCKFISIFIATGIIFHLKIQIYDFQEESSSLFALLSPCEITFFLLGFFYSKKCKKKCQKKDFCDTLMLNKLMLSHYGLRESEMWWSVKWKLCKMIRKNILYKVRLKLIEYMNSERWCC